MERRYFLGTVLMTSAFAHLGMIRTVEAGDRAPREFSALGRAVDWINSPPLTPEHLAGKVVLVNVWTYTCINWLRTLPYVRAWAQKYQQQLVVVGVHTPEFPFERNIDNVRRAVRQMNIEYPVAIDNDYSIWRAFDNHYWPALYFVDSRGRVLKIVRELPPWRMAIEPRAHAVIELAAGALKTRDLKVGDSVDLAPAA